MKLLITAGPTREPIDDVRFISNRSSGRMGLALADAAVEAGHEVTLLLGPVMILTSAADRYQVHRFETCAELEALLGEHFPGQDALVMAAAVADYRPASRSSGKMPRAEGLELRLEPTPDLVAQVAAGKRPEQRVVAFALELEDQLEDRALAKMRRKGVDAIVANPLATMDATTIHPVWMTASGAVQRPGGMEKPRFASWLVERVEELTRL